MTLQNLTLALVPLVFCAACTHHTPVVAQQPRPVPVEVAPAPAKAAPVMAKVAPQPSAATVAPTPRPTVMTEKDRTTLNERLAHLEDALFDYDKATIRADATNALKDDVAVIRGILDNYPAQKLLIEGHADERGSDEYNLALGDQRARAAEEFLANMGVSKTQLSIISFGKNKPVCTESSESCWQRNRRAHITAAL